MKWVLNREFLLVSLSQAAQIAGNLLIIKLLTRWFSIEGFGIYALAVSIFSLAAYVPFLPLGQAILRLVSEYESQTISFLRNCLLLHVGLGIVYVVIGSILVSFVSGPWTILLPLLFLHLALDSIKNVFIQFELGKRRRGRVLVLMVTEFGIKVSGVVLLRYKGLLSVENVFWMFCSVSALCIAIGIVFRVEVLREPSSQFLKMARDLWFYSYPLLWIGVFEWLRIMSQRWILNFQLDTESAACYSILTSLSLFPVNALQNVLGAFVMPVIYEAETKRAGASRRKIKEILPKIALVQCLCVLIILPTSKWVIQLFTDVKYIGVSVMLSPMLASCFFQALAMITAYEIHAKKDTKKLIVPMSVPGVLSLAISFLLIPIWGLWGAVVSFIVTNLIQGGWMFWLFCRKDPSAR